MSRVVVVGGGFGGTAAAARLAKLGHEVTLVERLDRLGGALGFVERDGFRWDAGPDVDRAAGGACATCSASPAGRSSASWTWCPVEPMREHRFEDGTVLALPVGQPGRAARGRRRRARRRASGGSGSTTCTRFADDLGRAAPRLPRAALVPRPRRQGEHARCCAPGRRCTRRCTRAFKDERLREVALLPRRARTGTTRATCPPGWACGPTSSRTSASGRSPAGWAALADGADQAARRRARCRCCSARPRATCACASGRVVGVRHRPRRRSTPTWSSCAIDPRGLPALAPHVAAHDAGDPAGGRATSGSSGEVPDLPHEVVLHGDPMLVRAHRRHAPPTGGAAWTVLGRGRLSEDIAASRWPGAGSTSASRSRCASTGRPRDQVEELARLAVRRALAGPRDDRPHGSAGARRSPGVYAAGRARRRRRRAAVRRALRRAVVAERIGPA